MSFAKSLLLPLLFVVYAAQCVLSAEHASEEQGPASKNSPFTRPQNEQTCSPGFTAACVYTQSSSVYADAN